MLKLIEFLDYFQPITLYQILLYNNRTKNDQYAALVQSTSEDTKSVITTDPIGSRGSVMEMNGTWQATGYLEMPLGYLNTIENGFTDLTHKFRLHFLYFDMELYQNIKRYFHL